MLHIDENNLNVLRVLVKSWETDILIGVVDMMIR